MNKLTQSYKYIIELTKAYQNDFITKEEYLSIITDEIATCAFRLATLKIPEIFLYSSMYATTMMQVSVILSQPKPKRNIKFQSGCVSVGEPKEEVIITPDNRIFTPSNQNFVSLPNNIKL
jgi:hypothetical protein